MPGVLLSSFLRGKEGLRRIEKQEHSAKAFMVQGATKSVSSLSGRNRGLPVPGSVFTIIIRWNKRTRYNKKFLKTFQQ